jgi:hypothetical protein
MSAGRHKSNKKCESTIFIHDSSRNVSTCILCGHENPRYLLHVNPLIQEKVDQSLEKCGGECQISVHKITGYILRKTANKLSKAKLNRHVKQFLDKLEYATLFYVSQPRVQPTGRAVYALRLPESTKGLPQPLVSISNTPAEVVSEVGNLRHHSEEVEAR